MFDGFDPRGKFWTDSNSMGMIERNLFHHDSFPYHEKNSNISSSYYPVDSAIAMRDQNGSNIQVTIMNDRAQGGSADVSGKANIELMQNRRTTEDDNKGVVEPLNETDSEGFGLRVSAMYYMQIFDFVAANSKQREQQILIDQPLQYYYSFDFNQTTIYTSANASHYKSFVNGFSNFGNSSQDLTSQLTYQVFPLKKNKIMVRFENLADRFDVKSNLTEFLNIRKFAQ